MERQASKETLDRVRKYNYEARDIATEFVTKVMKLNVQLMDDVSEHDTAFMLCYMLLTQSRMLEFIGASWARTIMKPSEGDDEKENK